jgi:hypothetical protein
MQNYFGKFFTTFIFLSKIELLSTGHKDRPVTAERLKEPINRAL